MEPGQSPTHPSLERPTYWLARFVILRLLGVVYAVGFLIAANQILPLIGSDGLLPVGLFVDRIHPYVGSSFSGFLRLPSLFWWNHSDTALLVAAWTGFALSCVVVAGFANALLLAILWGLYMSFVHLGQDWYGYGWEIQLLETGFLGIFLCPLLDARPFPRYEPPLPVLWLFRWLIFRLMLGAGLIKLRGDPAWSDFTALYYHFETQPLPNPLSRWFHFLPQPVLRLGVGFNHLAELIAPWLVFWPRLARQIGGTIIVLFQLVLLLSGNLSFLNWLTIIPALACFDDGFWSKVLPKPIVTRAALASKSSQSSKAMRASALVVTVLVAILSIGPVANMFSPHQIMNTSFDPLDLVNTYGAFGTVGRERLNVIFEGTAAELPQESADWKAYPYKGLPVLLDKMPPQIAPYQLRLDWQMWFAAMSTPDEYPWTLHLVWKLLHNNPGTLSLFGDNPFPQSPPRYVRAVLYQYAFRDPRNSNGLWWSRKKLSLWLPPLSADDPRLLEWLRRAGWLGGSSATGTAESCQ
ncbi:MAG: lipase maturation factor family protein [Verrucomicrobia bacterium]|nr:lipase maturation factor family protein [Verrucomicrobiota bacterium]